MQPAFAVEAPTKTAQGRGLTAAAATAPVPVALAAAAAVASDVTASMLHTKCCVVWMNRRLPHINIWE